MREVIEYARGVMVRVRTRAYAHTGSAPCLVSDSNGLSDDGAGDHGAELQADERHHRDEAVPERVVKDGAATPGAWGTASP